MATVRDALDSIMHRRNSALPDSDLFATFTPTQQTSAEQLAGVTPVNYAYAPCYVDRYGVNTTPGTTDMSAAFSAAIKVAQQGGGTVRYGASGIYLVTNVINATFGTTANQNGVIVRPDIINNDGAPAATILAKHTGVAVFDCTGNSCIVFDNVSIRTDTVTYPKLGILFARCATAGVNSQINQLINCRFFGSFSQAPYGNYGSENDVLERCYFENAATDVGTRVLIYTVSNIRGWVSPYVTIATGSQSCIAHDLTDCNLFNNNTDSTSGLIYNDGCNSLKVKGGWWDARGRDFVTVDCTNAAPSFCSFTGITGENSSPMPTYGFYFLNIAGTPTGWAIANCYLPSTTNFLFSSALVTLDNFIISNIGENASRGIDVQGTVQSSYLDRVSVLNLQNTTKCFIVGFFSNMTFVNPQTDTVIVDTLTGNILTSNSVKASANLLAGGGLGLFGNSSPAQVTGWGTPTGAAVIANFPGSTATLLQCSNAIAKLISDFKAIGFYGA